MSPMRCVGRMLLPIAAVVAGGCWLSASLAPGDTLVGQWASADQAFTATSAAATLRQRCLTATFGALSLDDSLRFEATGVVTQATGLITLKVGDPWHITGRVVGSDIVLGADTLPPGTTGVLVCNAA